MKCYHCDDERVEGRSLCRVCTNQQNRESHKRQKEAARQKATKLCKWCHGKVKDDKFTFCSNSCSAKYRLQRPEDHPAWKGEDGATASIHRWINKMRGGRPKECEWCKKDPGRGKDGRWLIHWANLSGDYKRDITDWAALCIKCHFNYDKPWKKRERKEDGTFAPQTR